MTRLLVLCGCAAAFALAESKIEGPALGYVEDAGALRRVAGIPGAAVAGDALAGSFQNIAVSPGHDFAIAVRDGGEVVRLDLKTGEAVAVERARAASRIVLSPSATHAVLLAGDTVQVLAGTEVSHEFTSAAQPDAIAVSDDGLVLYAAGDSLYAASAAGHELRWARRVHAIAFFHGSRDAVLASADQVLLLKAGGDPEVLAGGVATALAVSAGNASVLMARARSIDIVRLEAGTRESVDCSCDVTSLEPLSRDVYRVSAAGKWPLWILETSGDEPRTWFVPRREEARE